MTTRRRLGSVGGILWRAHPLAAAGVLVGTVLAGALPVAAAWLVKETIDRIAAGRLGPGLYALIAGIALGLLAGQLLQSALRYLQQQLARRAEAVVSGDLFARVNAIPGLAELERPGFHDRLELAQRAGQQAPHQVVSLVSSSLQTAVSVTGFAGSLLVVSPRAALLVTVAALPQLLVELRFARRRADLRVHLSPAERRRYFYARLQSEPAAAKELRLFGLGEFFHGRMLTELAGVHRAERALDRRTLRAQALLDVASALVVAVALAAAARDAVAGRVSPGDVALLLAAVPALTASVAGLVGQLSQGAEMMMLLGTYEEVMAIAPAAGEGREAAPLRREILLDDVWFRYADDLPWVLRGVTLRIPLGGTLGLVGLNGAGKSTVVKLIGRLYEPTKGRVLWDGVDLREIDHDALRQRIAMVFQDYMTYDLTAEENIGVGDLDRLDDAGRVREAARIAGVDGVVERLPGGYSTMLSRVHARAGDGSGVELSGGQWQRLALARMLLRRDRDLLILDEPSAGLDARAEAEIQEIVRRRTAGSTRLLITHRLNTVRTADRIAVLEDGRITAEGTHESLMAADGRYAELFLLQAAGYEAPKPASGEAAG